MSSIPFFGRLMRKSPHSAATPSASDRTISPSSSASFYVPEDRKLTIQKPKVNISVEAFPYVTQVPWPPSKPRPPTQNTTPADPATNSNSLVAPKSEQPSSLPPQQQQQQQSQLRHPESLIPARRSTTSPPLLIDIPIDSGPALNDDMFRRKSDTNSSGKSGIKPIKVLPQRSFSRLNNFSFPDKSSEQPFIIPMGEHLKNGQRSSSPSIYSDSSSTYSYVSAPELEYGDDDLYGLSSLRSHRLTRKDSSTLPQDLIWHLLHGSPREDEGRSRRSSLGKRSIKSRRNSDGGASIHTARRSKSKSRFTGEMSESSRAHSRSRAAKSKHPRMSGTSVSSSSVLASGGSFTPSSTSGFTIVNGHRNGAFPLPTEPMPVHAVKTVQAAQASIEKGNADYNPNSNSNSKAQPSDSSPSQAGMKPSGSPRNKKDLPLLPDHPKESVVEKKAHPNHFLGVTNAAGPSSKGRTSFMEYLDSPLDDKVTLVDALTGYNLPIMMNGSKQSLNQPHAYANFEQSSNNAQASSSKKVAVLPPLPRNPSPLPPKRLPGKAKASHDLSSTKKPSPPVLPPVLHDKSQSDSLYPELSDRHRLEGKRSSSHSPTPSTTRPRPSPSRPLPTRPPVPPSVPVAGPSKSVNTVPAFSSGHSNSVDKSSWKTIESDKTIKPIDQPSTEGFNINSSNKPSADRPTPHAEPPIEGKSEEMVNTRGDPDTEPSAMPSSEATPSIAPFSATAQQSKSEQVFESPSSASSSSSSSLPISASNATSEDSRAVEQQQQQPPTQPIDPVDSMHNDEGLEPDSNKVVAVASSSGHGLPDEPQISENESLVNGIQPGSNQQSPSEDTNSEDRCSPEEDGDSRPAVPGMNPEIASEAPQANGACSDDVEVAASASTQNNVVSAVEKNHISSQTPVEGIIAAGVQRGTAPEIGTREVKYMPGGDPQLSTQVADDKQDASMSLDTFLYASPLSNKEDSPLSDSINSPRSFTRDHEFNPSVAELRKSIHDSSIVSMPWNSSTGSVGSHRFRNEYYLHQDSSISAVSFILDDTKSFRRRQAGPNASQTQGFSSDPYYDGQSANSIPPPLHPEHYPLPPSSSSIVSPYQDDPRIESNRAIDGRTSSPNALRSRPFSPESTRAYSPHNIDHKHNRSAGDLSQLASEAAKMSSLLNQRPSSRTSSAFMSTGAMSGTRAHRSSTLPTVDGVSPAPFPQQSNGNFKNALPIGSRNSLNESMQTTRQRSGSEPHPSVLYHRAAGRLSTIQQSPIQGTRPAALPLRGDRPIGSMTFPETPYEYTPIPTPGSHAFASPHIRGGSFPANGFRPPRKPSRLGSDVSLRRPAGPRPQRNVSGARNASSKMASPPTSPRSLEFDPGMMDGGVLPDFRPRPVEWRAYTLEAAQWTFTSEQLQEIVGQAIRQSAIPSTVRLLSLSAIDEIKPEIERLEILQQDVTIRYCANVTRRRVILKSLRHHLMDPDWTKRSQLLQELNDTSFLADQLTKDLFHTMYRLQQLYRLRDVHNGSALAMALRKLNSSFVKQLDEMTQLSQYTSQLEEEKEEAWATAERLEREVMDLREKLEAMSAGTASEDSSRRNSARKRSVRASKASFRLSKSTRLSHSSTNSNYALAPPPPVPPVPRIPQTPSSRVLSLNTDVSLGVHSMPSAQSLGFSGSPTPESRAMAQAQRELYDLLGFPAKRRRSIPSRTRPLSEILSPVTATDGAGPMSPYKAFDHPPFSFLRRNNSIPISPHIISENFRD